MTASSGLSSNSRDQENRDSLQSSRFEVPRLPRKAPSPVHRQIHKSPDANTRRALGHVRFSIIEPGGTGNIEMRPRGIAGPLLQEVSGGDRSAPAAADISQVGERRFQVIAIVVVERHMPQA